MGVGDWLRSLGLGQYEAVFRESEIDPEVLPELTDADLDKLGVSAGTSQAAPQSDLKSGPASATGAAAPRACPIGNRRGRATPTDGDVLRSCRFDRAISETRS